MSQLLVPPKARFVDDNGDPLASGLVYTYEAGTSTPLATYTNQGGGTPNANPVVLDSRGEADIWLANSNYKIVLKDSDGNTIWTVDNVKYIDDGSIVTAMIANSAITTAKINDGAVTFAKLATGTLSYGDYVTKTADYTALTTDDIILIDAVADDVTISLPSVASAANKYLKFYRTDDMSVVIDTFVDGDVNATDDEITLTSHSYVNTQKIRLTTSGTLPAGLSLATDYYVIYVDANTIKLASSKANAEVGTAVNITGATGGGTHTVTPQNNTVTIDGYLSETIDNAASITLDYRYQSKILFCDGTEWFTIAKSEPDKAYSESSSCGSYTKTSTAEQDITNLSVSSFYTYGRKVCVELIPDGTTNAQRLYVGDHTGAINATLKIYRDSTQIGYFLMSDPNATASSSEQAKMEHPVKVIDSPQPGTYTYKVTATKGGSSDTLYVSNFKLSVREL